MGAGPGRSLLVFVRAVEIRPFRCGESLGEEEWWLWEEESDGDGGEDGGETCGEV